MITAFKNIFDKTPYYKTVDEMLARIKEGKSREKVDEIRNCIDKERKNQLKCNLPSICFSGKFTERKDECLQEHSGFICLDFDEVPELRDFQTDLINLPYVYACWVSPSGNGLKALVKIADPKKHREHFTSLQEELNCDKSGINVSRVCYESYDPDIYINTKAEPYKKFKKVEKITEVINADEDKTIRNLLTWLSNKGDAFVTGERNLFIFKFASACCRYGIDQSSTFAFCNNEFLANDNTFTRTECERTIKSAYRANTFGTAKFENERLIDSVTRGEVDINADIYNLDIRPKDVIYGEDVKADAFKIFDEGHERVNGIGFQKLDKHFKLKRGEVSLITGIGNYGKSTLMKWYLLLHAIKHGRKFALFAPEDNPASEFYHDLVEIYLGCGCHHGSPNQPTRFLYEAAFDFVSKHFFYIYPKEVSPTPAYIKERFLELIIKEKVDGCIVDPFNQMTNDYSAVGGRDDKYLEAVLGEFDRFANLNQVFFIIVAHPKMMHKDSSGNYPCPDVFDLSGGAMWNNKMYNILVYHRPAHQQDPNSPAAELHFKKIKRQKIVGEKGSLDMEFVRNKRRFYIEGVDVLSEIARQAMSKDEEEVPF